MTFVLAGGGIDLSVGSSIAFTACFAGTILKLVKVSYVVPLAIASAIILGLLIGLFNGTIVSVFKIPPLIVTLGSMSIFRGCTYLLMQDRHRRAFPEAFTFLGQGHIARIPVPFVITLVAVIIGSIILHRAKFGRYILSIGGSREAAKRAGIHVMKYEIFSYVIVGGLAGLGGVILAARLNAVQAIIATGAELHIITVVVLGGTYLFGGYATIVGTLLGALFLGVTENGLLIIRIPFYWQTIIVGILLILAVGIQLYRFRVSGVVGRE
jgi:ribose/xylose/arabinose/galactoside ABC-type transport system permease subunit